jgi:3-hydroxyisobutyrate dehydrogenase
MGANMARRLRDVGYTIAAVYDVREEAASSAVAATGGEATVSPQVHVDVQSRAEASGASSLEACIASSIDQARDGPPYLMVVGREEVYRSAMSLFAKLSTSTI